MHDFIPDNSLRQINRLPSEIIEIIFIHCARHHYQSYSSDIGVADWVNVSYVCRRWRNVALNCATLWTYHFITSLRWTEELLVRSKQASLKIHLHWIPGTALSWSSLLDKLMNHVECIQELRLYLQPHFLPTRFFLSAPRLQTLAIRVHSYGTTERHPTLFDVDTPALRTLNIRGCEVPWYSLGTLTGLFLRAIPRRSRLTMAGFRAVLSRMQNLVVLCLRDALLDSRVSSPLDESLPKITLPRLFFLGISAPFSTIIAFLSCVDISLKAHITLEFRHWRSLTDDYAPILHFLAKRFSLAEDPPLGASIHSVSIYLSHLTPRITLTAFEYTTYEEWSSVTPLDISFPRHRINRMISDICCSMSLTQVQHLFVNTPPFSSAFWEKILGHLRGLRHITLSDSNMPDLCSVLSLRQPTRNLGGHDASNHDSAQHAFVPALEELELHQMRFLGDEDCGSGGAISQSALFDALSSRGALRDRVTIT